MATMDSPAARHSAVVVEDLIQGLNEWRNIQDIVRLTFKAFHDVLKAQGEAIKTLERSNEGKADKNEVASALSHKASTADLNAKLVEINCALATKADGGEVAHQLRRLTTKSEMQAALRAAMSEVKGVTDAKANLDDIQYFKGEMEQCLETLRVEMRRKAFTDDMLARLESKASINEVNQALELKADAVDVDAKLKEKASKTLLTSSLNKKADKLELDTAVATTRQQLMDLGREHGSTLSQLSAEKADRHELDELRSLVTRELGSAHEEIRASTARMEAANAAGTSELRSAAARCESSLEDLRKRVDGFAHSHESAAQKVAALSERLAVSETKMTTAASTVTSMRSEVNSMHERVMRTEARLGEEVADRKAGDDALRESRAAASALADLRSEVSCSLELKADVAQVNDALAHKANLSAMNTALERLESGAGASGIRQQLDEKANVKDVCFLIDMKSNITDVNSALAELQRGIDARAPLEELRRIVREQAVINASLCADCSIGRWIWKSGKTKSMQAVPWNIQSVNTDPENFLWEKDRTTICCAAPGLYEITFGFFTHKKPTIQLLVNGEPVLSAINSSSYVTHHSSGRLASVGRHPAGNVTGLTCIDFLALPPRARIAITFSCDETGEAFVSLKKL